MVLGTAGAVAVGGVAGVLVGILYFRALRLFAGRMTGEGEGRGALLLGLSWRLAVVVLMAGLVAYLGGTEGTVAMLVGLILARVMVPRRSGSG
ncbi:hypothetical protein [Thiohalorhabdus methylotrophus]|uniref:ATP synthase subunit I n=1 Tax=Thiohalorhabdus methylotrophus TaxID=3242694 RepID=A0ABV4TYT8_9GAMM